MTQPLPPSIFAVCREGFRRNRVPALVLQAFAALLLGLYFLVPGLRPVFEALEAFKARTDPGFAMVSTALFGGVIPWMVQIGRGRIPRGERGKHFLFLVVYWAIQGAIVNALYAQQAAWFGTGRDPGTLLIKTLVDQGPFNLLYATPAVLVAYGWRNADFSWSRFRREHAGFRFWRRYAVIQVSSWTVWVPAVLMIYCLPTDLQVPLFNLVMCFFSLLLVFVSREG